MTLAELQQAFDEAKTKYRADKTNKKAKKAWKKAKKALNAAKENNNGTETTENNKKRSLSVSEEKPSKKAKTGPSLADLKKANKEAKAAWKASDGDKNLKKIWKKAKAALAEAKAQQGEQEVEKVVEVKVDIDALKAAVKSARKIFKKDKSNKEAKAALKAAKKAVAEAEANAANNEETAVEKVEETAVEKVEETAAADSSMDILANLKKTDNNDVLSGLKKGGGGYTPQTKGSQKGQNPPSRRLFIGNLNFSIDDDKTKEFFKDCGEVTDLHWLEHRDSGKFKGCGFISFATLEEAQKAMEKNGEDFMGRPITIDYDKERAPRKKFDQEDKPPSRRLFLGNVSHDADDTLLTEFFKDCGTLEDIHWVTDRDSGEFRGFGFCTFSTQEEATKAFGMSGTNFLGRRLRIDYTLPRASRGGGRGPKPLSEKLPGCTSIFIGNLSDEIDDDKIRELFKEAGEISQIRWLKDRDSGEFKGAGFVEFEDPDKSLDLAVKHNGEEILGKSIRIDYAKPRAPRP